MRSDLGVANGTNNQGINGYVASLSTGFTLKAVQTAYGSCWFGAEHVDLIVTTQIGWDQFWNKLQPLQRFHEESSDVAKAGFVNNDGALGKSDELLETLTCDDEGNQQPSQECTPGRFRDYRSGTDCLITGFSVRRESDDIVRVRRNAGKLVQSFRFNGSQVVVDQYCPTGEMHGLNTRNQNMLFYISTLQKYQFGQIEAHR